MGKGILITQCLQNDFVEPIQKYDPVPNMLHVGYGEALRLMGEIPEEGPVLSFMEWAYSEPEEKLEIVHIRDWHDQNDPNQKDHLSQFGPHCIKGTHGSEFVFQNLEQRSSRISKIINASGLNDFYKTNLEEVLNPFSDREMNVGLAGVWTEAKITYLAYELRTRYPKFRVGICSALTASSSRHMHYVALDQLKSLLGLEVYSSLGTFSEFLTGTVPLIAHKNTIREESVKFEFDDKIFLKEEDRKILFYLFRDCRSVTFECLDGGFSGNVVLRAKSVDQLGHSQVPTVIKIGERNPIAKERTSFERIEEVLGNNAPRIVDFAEMGDRGGIKYRYAAMLDGKTQVFQELYEASEENSELYPILETVFKKQLGRLYDAAEPEKLNLLEYYDFQSKYSAGVRKRVQELVSDPLGSDTVQLPLGRKVYNVCNFYEKDLLKLKEYGSIPHYLSYVHGDLNGRNIIIDPQKNVWLIDFFHTHRGHVLRDLIKLENDVLYIFTKIEENELEEAFSLSDLILSQADLGVPPDPKEEVRFLSNKIRKAYKTICKLRSFYPNLIRFDRDPYQTYVAILRYSMHTLSFDESSRLQKIWALYTGSICAEKIKQFILSSKRLRIDMLDLGENKGRLGLTILPGRRDRDRDLEEDIQTIKEENMNTVVSLLTGNEYQEYGVPDLKTEYYKNGLEPILFPILDQRIPDRMSLEDLLNRMDSVLSEKKNVLIHCVGGLGRSGTVAGAYLIRKLGYSADQAIRTVRSARSERAIESREQEEFLRRFASSK
ncbi:isochorismatase family protein [Leptospira neocaledonica]|uniref:Isochorismatase n=1 Tax=Leptospira neocaledonica TaxID=2023192 RepID=A0A2N0A1U6_9LEPT|nr:isochorismatase family protein [Leptospira neocaledonica]PJZ78290.1 isochorismatase [Leptospira neocaledonica]